MSDFEKAYQRITGGKVDTRLHAYCEDIWNAAIASMQGEAKPVDENAFYQLMKVVKDIIDVKSLPREKLASLCSAYFVIRNAQSDHDYSDLESEWRQHAVNVRETIGINPRSNEFYAGWKAALRKLASIPAYSNTCLVRSMSIRGEKAVIECWADKDAPIEFGTKLFTYPPSASAEIARLQEELEEARKALQGAKAYFDSDGDISANSERSIIATIEAAIRQIGGAE